MKTFNTEVLVAIGETEITYSVKSPKTGKSLSLPFNYLPAGMPKRIEEAVYRATGNCTGYAMMDVTLDELVEWKKNHDEYVDDMMGYDDEPETEPYEVRFGPRGY